MIISHSHLCQRDPVAVCLHEIAKKKKGFTQNIISDKKKGFIQNIISDKTPHDDQAKPMRSS